MSWTDVMQKRLALVGETRAKWRAIALSTEPMDNKAMEEAISLAYELAEKEPPKEFTFVPSPREGTRLTTDLKFSSLATEISNPYQHAPRFRGGYRAAPEIAELFADMERMVQGIYQALFSYQRSFWLRHRHWASYCGGQFDAAWLCYEEYKQETARGGASAFRGMMDAARAGSLWWPYPDICVLSAKPLLLEMDDQNRLHNPHGPALLYPDEFRVWALYGVPMRERDIASLPRLNARRIEQTANVEQRRALMQYYGEERYLLESHAQIVHQDDFGTLYRKEEQDGEPLVMVKVVNSTPEPDGTYKDYFLRVPPTVLTAKEAVAWTFDLETDTYAPLIET